GVRPGKFAVITGPSHAEEVARHLPTTVVTASENHSLAEKIQDLFTQPYFRVYTSEDLTGCETGGSLKNVIAIAAGIIDGLGLGDNTKAALLTRGLAEMSRLGIALGANPLTFSGLSGLGDLFVTCNSKHSRNRRVGEKIGKGKTLEEISKETKTVAEGVFTAESAYYLGLKHNVEMPIAEQVFKILFEGREPTEAIKGLMARSTKREWWW
ncbi:MAG: NAD(P)H-dependent glycerol-3-phosphate dehydrogenase, partial [Candidatus Kapaibacterium sp.]